MFKKKQPMFPFTCATWGTEVTTSARWGFDRRWLSRTCKPTRNKSFSVLFSMVLCHPRTTCQLPWCLSFNWCYCRVLLCSEPIASCSEYLLDEKLYDTWWLRFRDRGFRGKGKTCFELFPLGLSIKDRLTWTASEKKGYNNVIPWFQCP